MYVYFFLTITAKEELAFFFLRDSAWDDFSLPSNSSMFEGVPHSAKKGHLKWISLN